MALSRGVSPLSLRAFKLAPRSIKYFATSGEPEEQFWELKMWIESIFQIYIPYWAAMWSGVSCITLLAFTSAPFSIRILATSGEPNIFKLINWDRKYLQNQSAKLTWLSGSVQRSESLVVSSSNLGTMIN